MSQCGLKLWVLIETKVTSFGRYTKTSPCAQNPVIWDAQHNKKPQSHNCSVVENPSIVQIYDLRLFTLTN